MTNFDTEFIKGGSLNSQNSSSSLKFTTQQGKEVYSPVSGEITDITRSSITVYDKEYYYNISDVKPSDTLNKGDDVEPKKNKIGETKGNSVEVEILDKKGNPITPKEFFAGPKTDKKKSEENTKIDKNSGNSGGVSSKKPDIMGRVVRTYNLPISTAAKVASATVKRVFGLKEEIERIKKLLK